ncbi:Fpg/Nei family DNA glycosylase [Corynebacterium lizhenjunii]|uniref:DNA-(apurinic or apyrimidinic site) lyase n=1 Tax=Corynebacterium lizhenjunii TaxID=2709394 RepID=A0A7T0KFE7_9CORY|nr:Fpg/Nei family DNA glycosylase [Corynebacterium lizhenjunii]QPK79775.1 Fpg/Nei family DNA glycosylase [Corynebacterium lizhenjunii]
MPEGDSVLQLSQKLKFMEQQVVAACSIRVPRFATVNVQGWRCTRVWPYGKHLFMSFAHPEHAPLVLHTHLKMDGRWGIYRAGQRWRQPAHTARVVLRLGEVEVVGHRLGMVEVFPQREYAQRISHLGPDILDPQWQHNGLREEAIARIEAQPQRAIGVALLDQGNVAGIGNEYRAETCFIAGVHPGRAVAETNVPAIVDIARRLMWANRNAPVRVSTGVRRAGETTYVFGRENARCRRCGTPIAKASLGEDYERIIWWCPQCQPA